MHSPTRPMRAEGLGHTKQGFSMAGVAGGEILEGCHAFWGVKCGAGRDLKGQKYPIRFVKKVIIFNAPGLLVILGIFGFVKVPVMVHCCFEEFN